MIQVKQSIQSSLNRLGYKVEKYREAKYFPFIEVFDLVVKDYINRKGNNNIFFIQLGAHDGITQDHIRKYILEYHWSGILVEQQPKLFDALQKNYSSEPQLIFENVAIDKKDGYCNFYTLHQSQNSQEDYSLLATADTKVIENLSKQRILNIENLIEENKVPAMTINTLLTKHNVNSLDLLQIDIEGLDFEVIKMLDFALFKPPIIHFEHVNLSIEERYECFSYLAAQGYRLCNVLGDTIAYLYTNENGQKQVM